MKFLINLFVISFITSTAFAGTEINNGGSGIRINGKVATFYSVEMQVQPEALTSVELFSPLDSFITALPIPGYAKLELMENITPTSTRKYYSIKKESIDETVISNIKNEYSRLTGLNNDDIAVFALTDPESKITLLLPDFFELTTNEKIAILFHESLWIGKRVTSYEKMIQIERNVQVYLTYSNDCLALRNLVNDIEMLYKYSYWSLLASLNCEENKYTKVSNGTLIKIRDFFSPKSIDVLATIILSSSYKLPTDFLKIDLADSMKKDTTTKIFNLSRNELISKLLGPSMIKAPIKDVNSFFAFNRDEVTRTTLDMYDPLSQNNKAIVKQFLNNNIIIISNDKSELDVLKLTIPQVTTIELKDKF